MERIIKFRAWHTKLNQMFSAEEMAQDELTLLPTGKFINVSGTSTKLSRVIDDMIPLQFTGLKDKNGRDIYEGDIVSLDGWEPKIYQIRFIYGHFVLAWFGEDSTSFKNGGFVGDIRYAEKGEVVGDIFSFVR